MQVLDALEYVPEERRTKCVIQLEVQIINVVLQSATLHQRMAHIEAVPIVVANAHEGGQIVMVQALQLENEAQLCFVPVKLAQLS